MKTTFTLTSRIGSLLVVFALAQFAFLPPAMAQENEPPVQGATIQKSAIIVAEPGDSLAAPIRVQAVQLSGGDGAMWEMAIPSPVGGVFASYNAGGAPDMMGLLHNKSVREEIELVDEQYQKMQDYYRKSQQEINQAVKAMMKPVKSGDGKINRSVQLQGKKLKELIEKQKAETEKKLKELLLPHQLKRLEQVSNQVTIKNMGTLNSLVRGKLKDELELTDEDIKRLKERSAKIEKKLQEDIAKLREKAKKDLLGELSSRQRNKLNELLGDRFEYKQPDFRSRIRELQNDARKNADASRKKSDID